MAGLVNAPNMGVYNVSKHAVVSLSETLYQDLALVTDAGACACAVPLLRAHRHPPERAQPARRPAAAARPTRSQMIARAMSGKAVSSGKVSAAQVAQWVFDACAEDRFYIYSHPKSLASVQVRLEDMMTPRNPTDPFAAKPELGAQLRAELRGKAEDASNAARARPGGGPAFTVGP
jgi:hypothetical protein